MNKKQIIKKYLLLLCPLLLVAVGVINIIILIPHGIYDETDETEETSKSCTESLNKTSESDEMIQMLKDARIESENMRLWESALLYHNYSEIINKKHIRGTEITKLYKGYSAQENIIDYYFLTGKSNQGYYYHGFENVVYSMTDQSLSGAGVFQSRFLDDVLEELDKRGAEYLGYITIEYPAPYFPTPHMTERKQEVIDALKDEIKSFIIGHVDYPEDYRYDLGLEPGEYQVYIMDFMDADQATKWILYDKKNKRYTGNTMVFTNNPEHCHSLSTHLFMHDDTDIGGITHSELFIKLSICNFTLVIE